MESQVIEVEYLVVKRSSFPVHLHEHSVPLILVFLSYLGLVCWCTVDALSMKLDGSATSSDEREWR